MYSHHLLPKLNKQNRNNFFSIFLSNSFHYLPSFGDTIKKKKKKKKMNGRGKSAILALLLFFSALLACFCFILVIRFIMELVAITNRASNEQQEVLWAGFGIALFIVLAFAFVVFAIFSGCGMLHIIINGCTKIAPAPTSVEGDHHQQAMV